MILHPNFCQNMSNNSKRIPTSASMVTSSEANQPSQGLKASFLTSSPSDAGHAQYSHRFCFSHSISLFPSAVGLVLPFCCMFRSICSGLPFACFPNLNRPTQINDGDSSPRFYQHQQKCVYLHRGPLGIKRMYYI